MEIFMINEDKGGPIAEEVKKVLATDDFARFYRPEILHQDEYRSTSETTYRIIF